ncbi:MAG: SHOCT domain-containing protein [Elusimicrobiota bacterium]
MHFMNYGYGMGNAGGIVMLVIVIVVAALAVYLAVNASKGGVRYKEKEESALDILKKRYAAGEISKEEFKEKKKDIL